ncbi:hypothetical protein KX452_28570, partial [Escherichia coli]|nr:hypothetical protein [Escherichia coli]
LGRRLLTIFILCTGTSHSWFLSPGQFHTTHRKLCTHQPATLTHILPDDVVNLRGKAALSSAYSVLFDHRLVQSVINSDVILH